MQSWHGLARPVRYCSCFVSVRPLPSSTSLHSTEQATVSLSFFTRIKERTNSRLLLLGREIERERVRIGVPAGRAGARKWRAWQPPSVRHEPMPIQHPWAGRQHQQRVWSEERTERERERVPARASAVWHSGCCCRCRCHTTRQPGWVVTCRN
jgi:hypothetical protein